MGLGIPEIIIIVLAIAIVFFGGKKITELARSLGSASGEFKKAKRDVEREIKAEEEKASAESTVSAPTNGDASQPAHDTNQPKV